MDCSDPSDPRSWVFQIANSWLGNHDRTPNNEGRLSHLKTQMADVAEPWCSANLWIPDETSLHYDPISYWIPIPWDNREGRVTLAGDATHPLPQCKSPL